MNARERRAAAWSGLSSAWDVIVVGGGITGAGVAREAARHGLSTLLVDRGDFASGTSSRSSKLVHGGLRYLAEGNVRLTWESVRERDRLLAEGPGLVEPIGFLLPTYRGQRPGRAAYGAGLLAYHLMGSGARHRRLSPADLAPMAPHVLEEGLTGGYWYRDSQTDDARLVLRVLDEAVLAGATVLNHVDAEALVLASGAVSGLVVRDTVGGTARRLRARAVVNAAGAAADRLRAAVGGGTLIRPLRGSHLVFPAWRFPVAQAVSFRHPGDGRPLFAFPWEGTTLLGTTDLDHDGPLDEEPAISPAEADYLLAGARGAFPALSLAAADAIASFAGVRPVVGTGKADPSRESRDQVLLDEKGLLTVTGGKLTTFRRSALAALVALRARLRRPARIDFALAALETAAPVPAGTRGLPAADARRLSGRYGARAPRLVEGARADELRRIPGTPYLWAELRWAARNEGAVHLDDLLLRRLRLGLLLPEGGAELLPLVRAAACAELGWDNRDWEMEEERYRALIRAKYGVPRPAAPAGRGDDPGDVRSDVRGDVRGGEPGGERACA